MDAKTLRAKRKAIGLTQTELGRLLGLTQNTISRWEQGKAIIGHPKMLALALEAIEKRKNVIELMEAIHRGEDVSV